MTNPIKDWLIDKALKPYVPYEYRAFNINSLFEFQILVNPSPSTLEAALTNQYFCRITQYIYDTFRYCAGILHDVIVLLNQDVEGDYILALPSDVAWVISIDGEVQNFVPDEKIVGWSVFEKHFTIGTKTFYFIIKPTANIWLSQFGFTLDGSEEWNYIDRSVNPPVVKPGTEFSPVKNYSEESMAKDTLFIALVGLIIAALVHTGKLLWANEFGARAMTTVNSFKGVSLNHQIKSTLDTIEADTRQISREATQALENAESVTGKVKNIASTASTIKTSTDYLALNPLPLDESGNILVAAKSISGIISNAISALASIHDLIDSSDPNLVDLRDAASNIFSLLQGVDRKIRSRPY